MDVAVLFANEAFYAAFTTRDLEAMEKVWSERENITCIHPGWTALLGREAVMESWRAILTNPQSPQVAISGAAAMLLLGEVAYVVCYEHLTDAVLAATNIFVREDGWWRLVHHQAGTSPPPAETEPEEPMRVQ